MKRTGMERRPSDLTLSGLSLAHPFSSILCCCSFFAVNQSIMFTSSLLPPHVPASEVHPLAFGMSQSFSITYHIPIANSPGSLLAKSGGLKAMEATGFQTAHHSLVRLQVLGQS